MVFCCVVHFTFEVKTMPIVFKKDLHFGDSDDEVLNTAFGEVWEKLTTNGGVWSANKHCLTAQELDDEDGAFKQYGVTSMFLVLAAHFIL